MLFMGEEWGASSPFRYFVSHSDPELVRAVRDGRKTEFKDFHGEGEVPDPQSEETFLISKLNWDEISNEPHRHMLNYYRALIKLRKQQPVLKDPDRNNLAVHFDEQTKVLVVQRSCAQQQIICLLNFSNAPQPLPVDADVHDWQQIFNSADLYWQGRAAAPIFPKAALDSVIAPESIIIYSNYYV
jgi:maltooligosyltrehalose trehalohydrolase